MSAFEQVQKLSFLINQSLEGFESAALINQEGQILGIKYESLPDLGTFAPLVQMARKYFPLKDGDIVFTNDPYSGGNTLSVMNFVTAIQLMDQTLYLAVRARFIPNMKAAKRLEDEGLRIPPSPLVTNSQINEPILSAIAAHPQAPEHFETRIRSTLAQVKKRTSLIKNWNKKQPLYFSKNVQKTLINVSRQKMHSLLSDLPRGENRLDLKFDTGETIKLRTEIKSGEIHFDFSGTSQSKRIFTTDHTTHGTCVGAVLSFLGQDFAVNEGIFSVIGVTTPQDCLLNAKYPAPVFEGIVEVGSLVASGICQSLVEITKTKGMGLNSAIPTLLSFEFGPDKTFYHGLAGGTGASKDAPGLDSYYMWSLTKRYPSIEGMEKKFPVLIHESNVRTGSGGKGQFVGGNGMTQEIEVLQDCHVKWLLGHRNIQTKGLKGAQAGLAPEILKISVDGERTPIAISNGEIDLKKNERLIVMSAGGGGYGAKD